MLLRQVRNVEVARALAVQLDTSLLDFGKQGDKQGYYIYPIGPEARGGSTNRYRGRTTNIVDSN